MNFEKNGKYQLQVFNVMGQGIWKFREGNESLITRKDGKKKVWYINSISDNELILIEGSSKERWIFSTSKELYSNDFMNGYIQDGKKVSIWEYYDEKGDLVIKIDYDTGNIFHLKKDTSDFVIKKDDNWIKKKINIYPTPIEGFYNFRRTIAKQVIYPPEAGEREIRGKVYVIFEIDSAGTSTNFEIINEIGGGCGNALLSVLQNMQTVWLPAQENGKIYTSGFIASAVFNFQNEEPIEMTVNYPIAKEIPEVGITAFGNSRPSVELNP